MVNFFTCQHFAHIRFAGRVTNHAGAAAKQRNGCMPGFLQAGHGHNGNKMPNVQTVRGGVKADIECTLVVVEQVTHGLLVCYLRNKAARL